YTLPEQLCRQNLPHWSQSTGPIKKHAWALQAGTSKVETGAIEHTPEAIDMWAAELRMRFGGQSVVVALEQSRGSLVLMLTKYEHLVIFPVHPALPGFSCAPIKLCGSRKTVQPSRLPNLDARQSRLAKLRAASWRFRRSKRNLAMRGRFN